MSRKKQISENLAATLIAVIFGDSMSASDAVYGVSSGRIWPSLLCKKIGTTIKPRVFATSGFTAAQILGRWANAGFMFGKPDIGIIYCGVNDPFSAVASSTAQAGSTSTTINLQSNSSAVIGSYVGNMINITGGTGAGQSKKITGYSGSTKIATVDSAWAVTPDATSLYTIDAPTQAQTQANYQALIKCLKFKAVGQGAGLGGPVYVYSQNDLPANGFDGQRYVVMNETSATGGAPKNNPEQKNNIAGDNSGSPKQTVWEFRNQQAGELGWARVATSATAAFSDGVNKIILIGSNYLNWAASAGDNYNVNTSLGTQYTNYVPIRAAAAAAAAAEGIVLCDLYSGQSMLINGGNFLGNTILAETAQGSNSWHAITNNQHNNLYGNDVTARFVYYTIKAQTGWIDDLTD